MEGKHDMWKSKRVFLGIFIIVFCGYFASNLVVDSFAKENYLIGGKVTIYKPGKFYDGYTLLGLGFINPAYSHVGGHIYLINMKGEVVHEWVTPRTSCQLSRLLPNGYILYGTRDRSNEVNAGIYELGWNSNVVWSFGCPVDHDFNMMENGHIIIGCLEHILYPPIFSEFARSPFFIEVNPDNKKVVWEWHGYKHIKELEKLVGMRFPVERFKRDWAHNNSCFVIPDNPIGRKDPRFRKGNIMFSYRSRDTIGIIDKKSKKIVWAWGPGVINGQHNVHMLKDGHILIFDNGTDRGWSRVIELDPLTKKIVWEYKGNPPQSFFSAYISNAQRLPNGNTLIDDGEHRRLFEVTPDKEIVWEWQCKPSEKLKKTRALRGLYRAYRYPRKLVDPMLRWGGQY